MKQNIKYLAISFASVGAILATGCATHKADRYVTASPSPCVIVPDSANNAKLDILLNVPSHYLSKRSRIVITPQLIAGDTVIDEFSPLAVYSPIYKKKVKRLEVLEGYVDPYSESAITLKSTSEAVEIPLSETVELPDGVENARMIAVISTDGCGECTGIDTLSVAAFGSPITLIEPKKEFKVSWIEPEFKIRPKIMEGKGVANLQFVINKHDINLGMGNNRQELDSMVAKLGPVLNDTLATLTSLEIFGMASADGLFAFNTSLSRNRANSAKNWLIEQLNISPDVQRIIKVGSRPEGWQPVLDAMKADNHPDTTLVQDILIKYADQNDDVAERYIRRLACWNDIKTKYLQKDRKVEYVYTYTIRSFTDDAELLDMYKKRPDAFNEDELLRVASLATDDKSRKDVYLTIMKYFPQSAVGANNLAVLYMNEGNIDEAQKVLNQQKDYTPEQLNTLAATYVYEGDYQHAIELLEEVDLPEARYNLGLLKAKQRKFEEAYKLLRPYNDINAAITALSLNRNDEAREIMAQVKVNKPLTEYVYALISARDNNDNALFDHLGAVCADERLRRRAADEPDFLKYADNERFKSIVGE